MESGTASPLFPAERVTDGPCDDPPRECQSRGTKTTASSPAETGSANEPEPEPAMAAEQRSAPASESPTGMWAVQLGSFGNQQNAERLASDLRKQGFAAFLSQLTTASGQLHRVRIGPQKDRDSAEAMAERLAKAGHKGQVVPHP